MEPSGLAFGEPKDRLRDIRERRSRISLRPMRATGPWLWRHTSSASFRADPPRSNQPDLMIGRPKFVLASGSPRRLALINQAGIEPDALRPAELDETPKKGELPRACANRLARAKAEA